MALYLDKEGLSTFLDCLREEELAPIQNDVSNLQQTKADNETVVNGLASVESKVEEVKQAVENIDLSPVESKVEDGVNTLSGKIDNVQGENKDATLSAILIELQKLNGSFAEQIHNIVGE